jgi:hypothetical protein
MTMESDTGTGREQRLQTGPRLDGALLHVDLWQKQRQLLDESGGPLP